MCVPFASFVDFPVFSWRVSSEGGFSPLFSFVHLVPVCQNVFLIPLVGLDIPCTIDDLRKSRGLNSVSAYRHGLYIQVHACGCSAE